MCVCVGMQACGNAQVYVCVLYLYLYMCALYPLWLWHTVVALVVTHPFFTHFLTEYWNKPNYYVTVARINGAMLNLNCALVLMPVLRNMLTA
jgi:isoprenylcysteine carboxyl methyltransferase (ICMT) family protein YpbQ